MDKNHIIIGRKSVQKLNNMIQYVHKFKTVSAML